MFSKLSHSLSTKLLLLFICAGVVLLLLVGAIVGKGFATHLKTSTQPFMVHYVQLMEQQLGTPPNRENAAVIAENSPVEIHVFGTEQWSTSAAPPNRDKLRNLFPRNLQTTRDKQGYQFKTYEKGLLLHTHQHGYDVYFEILQPEELFSQPPYNKALLLTILGVLVLIYYATKILFRPIEEIQSGVKVIGSGDLSHRISKRRDDQLGDLADDVNAMADDISDMLEAKRQLLLGISHELRSPLTRSRVNLALMDESSAKREVEKDIASMEQMITELLESERLNSRHVSLNLEQTRLDHLIREQVQQEFRKYIKVMEMDAVDAKVDVVRIKLLMRNLLSNAVKHSVDPERKPTVSVVQEGSHHCIYVTDSGEGIDPAQIPHLTEPFYRADPSRQRKTGGYGLGLHLCKVIVEAHGGKLTIASEANVGTKIRCAFPNN
ncbi:MAG: HAMP domain-containing protein [Acidiferrobacterales bacterium]|nr:HAMP domain-containing protein [Acidiferrobacterales bacterium]